MELVDHRGTVIRHLRELLNFNECTVLGANSGEQLVPTYESVEPLQSYRPEYDAGADRWVMTPCAYRQVDAQYINSVLDVLASTQRNVVVKMFPHKWREQLGLTEEELDQLYQRLTEVFDAIIPVIRLDGVAKLRSSLISAYNYGDARDGFRKLRNATAGTQPTIDEQAQWAERENYFRSVCLRLRVWPVWSEYLAANPKMVLAQFGIYTKLPFPKRLEYSKPLEELLTNRVLILGNSTIGRAVADEYRAQGFHVTVAGRRGAALQFDLNDRSTWGIVDDPQWHEIHYTVHDPRAGLQQVEQALELLALIAKRNVRLIVYGSEWGSISSVTPERVYGINYKMVKAALHMGVTCLHHSPQRVATMLLIHPGDFCSPLNPKNGNDPKISAGNIVSYLNDWDSRFRFVNVTNRTTIPF